AIFLPRRQTRRVTQQISDAARRRRGVRTRSEGDFACAGKRSKRIRLRRPIEVAERPGKPVKVVLGAVVVLVDEINHVVVSGRWPVASLAPLITGHWSLVTKRRQRVGPVLRSPSRAVSAAVRSWSPPAAAPSPSARAAATRGRGPSPDHVQPWNSSAGARAPPLPSAPEYAHRHRSVLHPRLPCVPPLAVRLTRPR